jgi:predicted membrane protein
MTIAYSYGFYVLSIKSYGHSEIVMTKNNTTSLHVAGLLGGAVDFLVQVSLPFLLAFVALCISLPKAFLANRVRRCFKTPYIAIVCWILAFFRFGCSIAATVVVTMLGPSFPPKWVWLFDATCIISVLVDTIIAASLCYHLVQGRKNSRSRW